MIKFTSQCVSKFAIAAVISGVFMAPAVYAADTPIDPTVQTSASDSTATPHESGMNRVEERIQTVHDTLNVTPAQESQWKKVAHVMRQNEASIHKLVEARHQNETANAIDDLKSYEGITRAHEQGLKRLIPVFETFYNSLSAEQKASADDMFGKYEGRREDKTGDASPIRNNVTDNGNDTTMHKDIATPADNNAPAGAAIPDNNSTAPDNSK